MFFVKKKRLDTHDINSIIEGCLRGDRLAQNALVTQYLSYTKSVCILYSHDQMDIDEMVNDGFMRIFSNLNKFDNSRSFKSWFRAVLVNSCIDHYRKNKAFHQTMQIEHAREQEFDTNIVDQMAADELLLLVQKLTPVYRMVFTLYVMEGYNHREIGDLLGIQEGTSKSNLRDARKKLQQMIYENYGHNHLSLKKVRS